MKIQTQIQDKTTILTPSSATISSLPRLINLCMSLRHIQKQLKIQREREMKQIQTKSEETLTPSSATTSSLPRLMMYISLPTSPFLHKSFIIFDTLKFVAFWYNANLYLEFYSLWLAGITLARTITQIVSVLHQNKEGIGKSIPEAQEISRDPRDVMDISRIIYICHNPDNKEI